MLYSQQMHAAVVLLLTVVGVIASSAWACLSSCACLQGGVQKDSNFGRGYVSAGECSRHEFQNNTSAVQCSDTHSIHKKEFKFQR